MEFSFDRSRQSNLNSANSSPTSNATVQASSEKEEIDTSTIANERLRKAIERNRARQKERDNQKPAQATTNNNSERANTAWAQHQQMAGIKNPREEFENHTQASFFDQSNQNSELNPQAESVQEETIQRPERKLHTARMRRPVPVEEVAISETQVVTRKSVAKPNEAEFAPVKKVPLKKAASHISYTTGNKKKNNTIDPKYIDYLVKGSWFFSAILALRLIFANGGVVDYLSQKSVLNNRYNELARIKNENMSLVHEIERMQLDGAYQKRLVRDNLGFIAQDEYLILFPQEKSN